MIAAKFRKQNCTCFFMNGKSALHHLYKDELIGTNINISLTSRLALYHTSNGE